MKVIKSIIQELYFLIAIIYYWSLTASTINWFAIGMIVLMLILIFTKNRIFGIIMSLFFALISLYLVLALVSELSEFKTFDSEATKLLLFGSLFLGFNLLVSVFMLIKYTKAKNSRLQNISQDL